MRDFVIKQKSGNLVIMELYALYNLNEETQLIKFKEIINLFDLYNFHLLSSCFVEPDSQLLNLDNMKIIKIYKKLFSKKFCYKIEIIHDFNSIIEILSIAANEDISLFIIPLDKDNSQIEMLINDNGHTFLTFDTQKYHLDKIVSKVKQILNRTG